MCTTISLFRISSRTSRSLYRSFSTTTDGGTTTTTTSSTTGSGGKNNPPGNHKSTPLPVTNKMLVIPPSMYAKRFQVDQYGLPALNEKDCIRRLDFAHKMLRRMDQDKKFLQTIVFSDEGSFRVFKTPGRPKKAEVKLYHESNSLPLIVWCGMTSKDIIGPYFFNSYVTENSYMKMLKTFMLPRMQELGYSLEDTWFQQDGAPPHRSQKVLKYLSHQFGNKLISYGCKTFWPAKSQDLTPLDYFLWDHLKDKLAINYRPTKMEDLKECISLELDNLDPDVLEKVIYDFRNRIQKCIEAGGQRFDARKDISD